MLWLPVRGEFVTLSPPGGSEELLVLESQDGDRALALQVIAALSDVRAPETLSVHDFELMLLELHRLMSGPALLSDAACSCGKRVDISFDVRDLAEHNVPRRPRQVRDADEPGWFGLAGSDLTFRLPAIGDQLAVARTRDPARALIGRCIGGTGPTGRAQAAMAAMTPTLSGPVEGVCPHCGAAVHLHFDVPSFVMNEVRVQAAELFEEVHLLAERYHWSEEQIVALPSRRRRHYANLATAERTGAF